MARRGVLIVVMLIAGGMAAYQALQSRGFADPTKPARLADLVRPGAAAGYNLLLVSLDTTRPDYLGCYGRKEAETPAIDSLLKHGVRFDDAITPVPLTGPAHASLLTGLGPLGHGVRNNGEYFLAPQFETMAERLKATGYDTAAFVSCFVLDKRFGFDQGFDVYDFEVSDAGRRSADSFDNERPANEVTNDALEWFKGRRASAAPFFAWVHYYDPHHPYQSPIQQMPRFSGRPYDAEIAFVDRHFRRLLDMLDEAKLRERTLIVVVSDHGESLNEHGEPQHGIFIYDSTVKIGMVFSCPTLFDGGYRVSDRVVGIVDVLPTVESLFGLPASAGLEGVSLLNADASPDRALYIESIYGSQKMGCSPLFGLRRHTDKFIEAPTAEYYDLREDPKELSNLFAGAPDGLAGLRVQLTALNPAGKGAEVEGSKRNMTAEDKDKLEALGYGGSVGGDTEVSATPCDPKDELPRIQPLWEATELVDKEKYEQAESMLKELVAQNQVYETPVHVLADLYGKLGRNEDAATLLEQRASARAEPDSEKADLLVHLAEYLFKLRRYGDMEEALEGAQIVDPTPRGSILKLRGDRYFEEQQYAKAAAEYEKALEIDGQRLGPEVRQKLHEAKEAVRRGG